MLSNEVKELALEAWNEAGLITGPEGTSECWSRMAVAMIEAESRRWEMEIHVRGELNT